LKDYRILSHQFGKKDAKRINEVGRSLNQEDRHISEVRESLEKHQKIGL
jgi:hypothetical protein